MPDQSGVSPGEVDDSAMVDDRPAARQDAWRWSFGSAATGLYALTLLLSAFLMFVVQPMLGKSVLPILGGTPAVWTTCMAFFQTLLLGGYAYAHLGSTRMRPALSASLHLALLGLALGFTEPWSWLPDPATISLPSRSDPRAWLVATLATSIGLPFLVLAATAPLLQGWYAAGGHRSSSDPYHLYAASNLGSLLALAAYPLVIEPRWGLDRQAGAWWLGFATLATLTGVCGLFLWGHRGERGARDRADAQGQADPDRISPVRWLRWAALAFVPSSYLLGVTTYLSTDIAAVPLLWVIPLALYLITLILAFSRRSIPPRGWSTRLFPVLALVLLPALAGGLVQPFWLPIHLATFFLGALVCHGELVQDRPATSGLTAFYLALAVGGAAGGVFNALIAPWAFDRIAEYPLALVLALLAVPSTSASGGRTAERRLGTIALPLVVLLAGVVLVWEDVGIGDSLVGVLALILASGLVILAASTLRSRPRRFALAVGAVLVASGLSPGVDGDILFRERNFYGVLRVTFDESAGLRRLFHGSTLHGQQSVDPARRGEPLSYFHPSGPIGDVFRVLDEPRRPRRVAIVGMGIGSLAAYARDGERWTFHEIDPLVDRVARDPRWFTYLEDSNAQEIRTVLGDARLRLAEAPDGAYDLIVLDAFSSDALPVHLMTREALRLYRSKLAAGGLLALNLSNRYLDLDPVLGALAADAGVVCRVRAEYAVDRELRKRGKLPSIWGVVAEEEGDLGALASDPRWRLARHTKGTPLWTDRWSSLLAAWRMPELSPSTREATRVRSGTSRR